MVYSLKSRTVEPEKQALLGTSCVTGNNGITVGSGVFCAASAEGKQQGPATIAGESRDGC
jgi:hypothetical protein